MIEWGGIDKVGLLFEGLTGVGLILATYAVWTGTSLYQELSNNRWAKRITAGFLLMAVAALFDWSDEWFNWEASKGLEYFQIMVENVALVLGVGLIALNFKQWVQAFGRSLNLTARQS